VVRFHSYFRAAAIMEEELANPQVAAVLYERAAEARPDDVRVWRRLAVIHRFLDRPKKQLEALSRLCELTEGEESQRWLRLAGRLAADKLGDAAAARSFWARLLERLPADAEALDRLIAQDRAAGSLPELSEHLQKRLDQIPDPLQQVPLLKERANLLFHHLGKPEEALAAWQRVLAQNPQDPEALKGISAILESQHRWSELLAVQLKRLTLTVSDQERAVLWAQCAQIHERHQNELGAAMQALQVAVSLDPKLQKLWDDARSREAAPTRPALEPRSPHPALPGPAPRWAP
jgi:tetratricopeptide (TPR) repeat protein